MHSPVNLLPSLKSNSSHVIEQTGRLSKHKAYLDTPFPSVQRDVIVVQLDHFILVKDRIIIAVTQGVVGCHWRRARGDIFFMASVIRFFFFFLDSTVWGELTCRATSGAGCVCTNFSPPAPPSADSHDCSDESRIPLLLNSSKHHFQTPLAGRGWECGGGKREEEGGLDLQQRQMQRGQNVFFDHTPAQTGQKDFFFWKDMTVGKQCPHCESKHCIM